MVTILQLAMICKHFCIFSASHRNVDIIIARMSIVEAEDMLMKVAMKL